GLRLRGGGCEKPDRSDRQRSGRSWLDLRHGLGRPQHDDPARPAGGRQVRARGRQVPHAQRRRLRLLWHRQWVDVEIGCHRRDRDPVKRLRLTYANVMSTVLVIAALGGATALAAQLGKNTVGSKQLKANAVTAAKIKKNAVTAAKIKAGAVN